MGRSVRGEGSIRRRTSGKLAGKWRVQWDYTDPETGSRIQIDKTFGTQAEGLSYFGELKAKIRTGQRVEQAKQRHTLTLGEFFEFLADTEWPNRMSDHLIRARKARYRKYWKGRWGDKPLTQIDALKVRTWYDELTVTIGASLTTSIKGDLVRVVNEAKHPYGKFPAMYANPFALTVRAPEKRIAYSLTPPTVRKALAKLTDKHRAIFALHILGGLRFSEVRAMTGEQIHWDEGIILVDRAVRVEFSGHEHLGLPKGGKVRRAVLCPTLRAILREVVDQGHPSAYVFPATTLENKWRAKKLSYSTWKVILKEASLQVDLDTHDLRLSHINWVKQMCPDIDDVTLKLHVGHEAKGVTEVNYTRVLSEAEKRLAAAIEREFGLPKRPEK